MGKTEPVIKFPIGAKPKGLNTLNGSKKKDKPLYVGLS
jgi:hypothetical protein